MDYTRMSDLEIAHHLTRAIPGGRWTSYGTIAEAIEELLPGRGLNGWRVAMLLLTIGQDGTRWTRLRNRDGVFNVDGRTADRIGAAAHQKEMDDQLRAEGCRVDGGVADPRRFIGVNELLTLVDRPAKANREVSPERADAIRKRSAERAARIRRGL